MKHSCCILRLILLVSVALGSISPAFAQETVQATTPEAVTSALAPAVPAQRGLTLEIFLYQGGPILWFTLALGFVALVMAVYFLFTVTPGREAPAKLSRRAAEQIRAGDLRGAYKMCEGRDDLLSRVLLAGLSMAEQDRYIIQEAMESEGQRGAAALWQKISYLNNIGVIAPLLGLLGTVWGMIGAFNTIAFDSAQVKGITMAFYVSQAMITTAGGLMVAIPTLMMYYYFRGQTVKVVARVEAQASQFVELIVRSQDA